MTDEKDNSDSDWEHIQIMSEETPPTQKDDTVQNEVDESDNNPGEKEEGEPPQKENAEVEESEQPPTDPANADEDSKPQEDSPKAEEDTSSQESPIKEEETPHESFVKVEGGDPSHDDSDNEEESEPPEDDLVKAKQLANPPENHPVPGKSCIIATRTEPPRFYVLKNGQPEFLAEPLLSGGHIWNCEVEDGWLTFPNETSGTFLGHNEEGKVEATQKEPTQQERFTARRKEDGGYMLFVLQGTELLGVVISEDGKSLVLQKGEGDALDFIDSKYLDSPVSLKYPNMPPQKLR
ncbi:hypothetical protein A0O28_0089730 [Trichoderma guizhouense]|uniref:Uncharacterized protein n=1 Tax=Trichoderma guizhouense TaxID=1491466 RepID=A0A1T3CV07_9HYPO|nr:hypothetical protein A0O28_0089730 [Trichoderma guizhouense]